MNKPTAFKKGDRVQFTRAAVDKVIGVIESSSAEELAAKEVAMANKFVGVVQRVNRMTVRLEWIRGAGLPTTVSIALLQHVSAVDRLAELA